MYMYFQSVRKSHLLKPLFLVLCFVVLMGLFITGLQRFNESTVVRQKESLEKAIVRDIAECYALEGVYPPSLNYMKAHYGLTYDETMFFVDYRPIGGNLYPDYYVTVLIP